MCTNFKLTILFLLTCQALALRILNAKVGLVMYVMKGAGCCMPFVLLIGLTAEMLPDTL